jgi:hypothetical protein
MSLLLVLLWPFLILLFFKVIIDSNFVSPLARYYLSKIASTKTLIGIWSSLILAGFLFRGIMTGGIGMFLTLALPCACYVISFAPYLSEVVRSSKSGVVLNGVLAGISTLIFWQFTVSSQNWKESGLIFVAIIPFLIMLLIATAVVLQFLPKLAVAKTRILTLVLFIFLISYHFIVHKNENYANLEVLDKIALAKAVVKQVKLNKAFDAPTLLRLDEINGKYTLKDDHILLNKYGGNLLIGQDNIYVTIKYTGIPAGEPCYSMYFLNNLRTYGFNETLVDGTLVKFKSSPEDNLIKNQLCFTEQSPKVVEFRGRIEDLRRVPDYP